MAQAMYRKIGDLGLVPDYKEVGSEESRWLKKFFGLPFLPPEEVAVAFTEDLMPIAPRHTRIESFADNMLETYISEEARFPPEMWTAIPNAMPVRTNNGCAACHRHFKSSFNSSHPNIFFIFQSVARTTNFNIHKDTKYECRRYFV